MCSKKWANPVRPGRSFFEPDVVPQRHVHDRRRVILGQDDAQPVAERRHLVLQLRRPHRRRRWERATAPARRAPRHPADGRDNRRRRLSTIEVSRLSQLLRVLTGSGGACPRWPRWRCRTPAGRGRSGAPRPRTARSRPPRPSKPTPRVGAEPGLAAAVARPVHAQMPQRPATHRGHARAQPLVHPDPGVQLPGVVHVGAVHGAAHVGARTPPGSGPCSTVVPTMPPSMFQSIGLPLEAVAEVARLVVEHRAPPRKPRHAASSPPPTGCSCPGWGRRRGTARRASPGSWPRTSAGWRRSRTASISPPKLVSHTNRGSSCARSSAREVEVVAGTGTPRRRRSAGGWSCANAGKTDDRAGSEQDEAASNHAEESFVLAREPGDARFQLLQPALQLREVLEDHRRAAPPLVIDGRVAGHVLVGRRASWSRRTGRRRSRRRRASGGRRRRPGRPGSRCRRWPCCRRRRPAPPGACCAPPRRRGRSAPGCRSWRRP